MYTNSYYQQSNLDWITVQSIEQVDGIPVQPNHKAWIMVQNEPIFALRQADAMGIVSTDLYKFEKYQKPRTEYVTAEQLSDIVSQLKEEIRESIISATDGANKPKHKTVNTDNENGK